MRNPEENQETITIGLTGDVMIGRLVNENLDTVAPAYIWGDLLPLLTQTDLNLINLEAALTTSLNIVPKVFNFKADPHKVQSLKEARIDVVNLANNHVLDYADEGLLETLTTLDHAGIQHVGAGRNSDEALAPVIKNVNGITIGILGCTDNEPTWLATVDRPGVNYVDVGDLALLKKPIEQLRPLVDFLILSIHWGPNMRPRPSQRFRHFAHELIDCGVDLLHGHSAHIFQGIEEYKGKLILYDTGDFVDDYYVDPFLRNDRTFLFLVEVGRQGIQRLRLIPARIDNFQVNRAKAKDAQAIMEHMKLLSKEMGTELIEEAQELVCRNPI